MRGGVPGRRRGRDRNRYDSKCCLSSSYDLAIMCSSWANEGQRAKSPRRRCSAIDGDAMVCREGRLKQETLPGFNLSLSVPLTEEAPSPRKRGNYCIHRGHRGHRRHRRHRRHRGDERRDALWKMLDRSWHGRFVREPLPPRSTPPRTCDGDFLRLQEPVQPPEPGATAVLVERLDVRVAYPFLGLGPGDIRQEVLDRGEITSRVVQAMFAVVKLTYQ